MTVVMCTTWLLTLLCLCWFRMSCQPLCVQLQVWKATVYLTPLIGGYLADAMIGRFWVILVFSCIYFVVGAACCIRVTRSNARKH